MVQGSNDHGMMDQGNKCHGLGITPDGVINTSSDLWYQASGLPKSGYEWHDGSDLPIILIQGFLYSNHKIRNC